MNGLQRAVAVVVLLSAGSGAITQPTIPKAKVPKDVDPELGAWIHQLYAPDAQQRYEALCALEAVRGRAAPAVPFVVAMLGDSGAARMPMPPASRIAFRHVRLNMKVVNVLGAWGRRPRDRRLPAPEAPVRKFKSSPVSAKMAGEIAKALKAARKDSPNEQVRTAAGYALGQIGIATVERHAKALKSTDAGAAAQAATKLGASGYVMAIGPLTEALNAEDARVRCAVAKALGRLAAGEATDALIEYLADKDKAVRLAAAWALGRIRSPKAVKVLLAALDDADSGVGGAAADALGRIGLPAVAPLIELIARSEAPLNHRAGDALWRVRDPAARGALVAALKHKAPTVRQWAAATLGTRREARAIGPLLALLDDPVADVRSSAARALGRIEDDEHRACKRLIGVLAGDADPHVRAAAAWALGQLGSGHEPAIDALLKALDDPKPVVRQRAAQALGMDLKAPRAVEPLCRLLKDKDLWVRCYAAGGLKFINDPRAVPALIEALRDSDQRARDSARAALVGITGQRLGPDPARWRAWWKQRKAKGK